MIEDLSSDRDWGIHNYGHQAVVMDVLAVFVVFVVIVVVVVVTAVVLFNY